MDDLKLAVGRLEVASRVTGLCTQIMVNQMFLELHALALRGVEPQKQKEDEVGEEVDKLAGMIAWPIRLHNTKKAARLVAEYILVNYVKKESTTNHSWGEWQVITPGYGGVKVRGCKDDGCDAVERGYDLGSYSSQGGKT